MLDWVIWGVVIVLGVGLLCYPVRKQGKKILFVFPVTLLAIVLLYTIFGGGFAFRAFKVSEQKKEAAKAVLASLGSVDEVIVRLKKQVAAHPKDAKAWFLLGRVYASTGNWKEAKSAYTLAHTLEMSNHTYTLHYAQSVWEVNHAAFDEKTRLLLKEILSENPSQPDALAMLAYDAYQRKAYQAAIGYWEKLLQQMNASSEEASKLRQAIAKAREEARQSKSE